MLLYVKVGALTFGLEGIRLAIASNPRKTEVGNPQSAPESMGFSFRRIPLALAGGVCQNT